MIRESQQRVTGGGRERVVFVRLTSAQVKALRATPQTIAPAPGAGMIAEFVHARLALDYGGTNVFTETADNLAFKYTDGSGAQVSQDIETTGFLDQSADTVTFAQAKNDAIVAASACVNKAIVLHNIGDGEFAGNAGADNALLVKLVYRIERSRL